jgi:hypothetical protein
MGKKKEIIGNTIELEMPPPPEAPKKKREITDKQRENLSKGMAILKAKRESKAKKDDETPELPPTPVAPAPAPAPPPTPVAPPPPEQPKKERKPRVVKNYLTTEDFNSFKSELLTSLRPPQQQQERYVAPTPTSSAAPTKESTRVISGSELLNKIFF